VQLTEINSQLIGINSQLTGIKDQLSETNSRIDSIEQSVEGHTTSLEKLEEMQTTLDAQLKESNDKTLLALKHEVMMTRALDMLARARLYLAQSNFGLAKDDVQFARDLLAELQANLNDKVLSEALTRLDLVLGNLPDFPVVASGDLEIAWQILMTGELPATATPEPAPIMTVTPNPTSGTPPSATPTP
jgi:chromosome segregation ATPase